MACWGTNLECQIQPTEWGKAQLHNRREQNIWKRERERDMWWLFNTASSDHSGFEGLQVSLREKNPFFYSLWFYKNVSIVSDEGQLRGVKVIPSGLEGEWVQSWYEQKKSFWFQEGCVFLLLNVTANKKTALNEPFTWLVWPDEWSSYSSYIAIMWCFCSLRAVTV